MHKCWGLILFLGLSSSHAFAFEVKNTFESYVYGTYQKPVEGELNPGNQIFALPSYHDVLDLRDDFRIQTNSVAMVVRPRWTLDGYSVNKENPDSSDQSAMGKLDLTNAFIDWNINDQWKAVVGLQVYQWGPGEFVSPSNIFFHFHQEQKSFLYLEKGEALVRLNWTPSANWNWIFIGEPVSNNEASFQYDKDFEPLSTLKLEYRAPGGSQFAGVIGTEGKDRPFFGEYFSWYMTDSFSIYSDLRHSLGSYTYDPESGPGNFMIMTDSDPQKDTLFTIANTGVRWEGRVDFRIEWFYNGLGWNKDALNSAIQSITYPNPFIVENLHRFQHSGLELPGRNYLYTSLRIPDLGRKKDASIYARYILSMQDNSGAVQLSADKAFGNYWTGYLELDLSHGDPQTEMKLLYDYSGAVGLRLAI